MSDYSIIEHENEHAAKKSIDTCNKDEIKSYIDEYIRPRVQSDGGEINFVSFLDNVVTVKLQGECSRCTISKSCFSDWLESELRTKFHEDIKLKHIIKKPYFWDI